MVDKITWQEAKDYQGTDTVVSLTGEVADALNMPGMITALFIGGAAMSGTGIGISITDPSTLPMALEDYKGKTITVIGTVGSDPMGGAQINATEIILYF